MRKYSLLFLIICLPILIPAQTIKGRVLQQQTREPLAFVTIVEEGSQNGTYSDIDGYFTISLKSESSRLIFSSLGYTTVSIQADGSTPLTVYLQAQAIQIREVVILPGENPAEIIMRRVLANKDRNNPEKAIAFTYDSYNKLVFAGVKDSVKIDPVKTGNSLDSTNNGKRDFFEDKHLFLLESASRRKHLPPGKDEEVILATRVSGLKNPQFALLGTQLQSFSLYGEHVRILDISYLSPLSKEAISKYLFVLEDSSFMQNNTIYTISFRPRKNKNFVGMKGTLFISSDGWALQQVLAEPADSSTSIGIRIQQQYSKKQGVWFPEQLNSFLNIPGMKVNDVSVKGISKSYIRNVIVNPVLRKRDFGPVVLKMSPKATQVPDSLWNTYREHELDEKEARTYAFMDSVGKAENFDRKLKIFSIAGTGKIPLGPVTFDVNRLIRVNSYEGLRLGAGIHSNDFLSEKFSAGGYYAYGFKDKAHKYGGDLLVHLYRKRSAWMQVIYEDDVMESGGRQLDPKPVQFLNTGYYPFFISRMDAVIKKEMVVNGRLIGNLSANIFINEQEITPYPLFGFLIPRTSEASIVIRSFTMQEAGIVARWAPGEKLALAGEREVSLGSKWPLVYFRYTRGQIDEMDKPNAFDRYDIQMDKTFKTPLYGDLTLRLAGGHLPATVPSTLYYNAKGTNIIDYNRNRYLGIATPFTFETMRTNEFMHSTFLNVHMRHQFKDLLFTSKNFKPQITFIQNMQWGVLKSPERQLPAAAVAEKGFFESGISIDRLVHSGFSNLGLAFFYRYGAYAFASPTDNFVVKLSASFGF